MFFHVAVDNLKLICCAFFVLLLCKLIFLLNNISNFFGQFNINIKHNSLMLNLKVNSSS